MVKMVLGSSDSQATSVAALADNYTAGFESLISAFDSLANEDKLSGDAYTNIKSYGSSVVAPLVKAFILLADAAKADVQKLPDEYRAQVGGEDLDEETLTAQISAYATTIEANQTSVTSLGKTEPMTDAVQTSINNLNDAITSDTTAKTELEEKLRKLREYDAQSSGFFSDIAALESAVTTGLSQLQAGVTSFNGTFTLPSQKELEWTKTVNSQWEDREAYLEAVDKVNKGEELNDKDVKAIEAYQKAHPDAKIDKKVLEAVKATNDKKADIETTNSAKELSKQAGISYEDAYNFIVNGVLSDENKEKLDKVKDFKKFTKTSKNAAYISSSFRYWLKHKDEWTDEMFKARTFSKGGARIEDVKYVGKYLKKSKTLKKITSKLPSYEHGRLNRDLKMMKENKLVSRLGTVGKVAGKGLKAAGWLGTAFDAKDAIQDYKKKGYSNEQTAALATRKVAVDTAASAVGSTAGRVAGAAVGQILIPIPGVGAAIGSVAGSIVGGWLGSKVGDAVNTQLDKNVKPKKSGWSWPW